MSVSWIKPALISLLLAGYAKGQAPKGTPKNVIVKLNAAVKDALADPAVRDKLAALGQVIPPVERQISGPGHARIFILQHGELR